MWRISYIGIVLLYGRSRCKCLWLKSQDLFDDFIYGDNFQHNRSTLQSNILNLVNGFDRIPNCTVLNSAFGRRNNVFIAQELARTYTAL